MKPRGSAVEATDASYYPQLLQHPLEILSPFDGNRKTQNARGRAVKEAIKVFFTQ